MTTELTEGAIEKMTKGESICKPVVKVTDLRLENTSSSIQHGQNRYVMELSDGKQALKGMLARKNNFLVGSKALQNGSVIQLSQFACHTIQGRTVIIVVDLNVLITKEEVNNNTNNSSSPTAMNNGSLASTFIDLDLLVCFICSEFLSIPVYQCENGHMLCSACYLKLSDMCPFCRTQTEYTRCRPIEKVLESLKMPCQNTAYGCKEIFSHSDKLEHEKMCNYLPCSCPLVTCNFFGSQADLAKHCRSHSCIGHLLYDERIDVSMNLSQEYLMYQEGKEGTVFIIRNITQPNGNAVSVSCIGPPYVNVGFSYDLTAITSPHGSSLRLRSTTKVVQGLSTNLPVDLTESLIVPRFRSSQTIKLRLLIRKYHEQPELINISKKRRKSVSSAYKKPTVESDSSSTQESDMSSSDDSGPEASS